MNWVRFGGLDDDWCFDWDNFFLCYDDVIDFGEVGLGNGGYD